MQAMTNSFPTVSAAAAALSLCMVLPLGLVACNDTSAPGDGAVATSTSTAGAEEAGAISANSPAAEEAQPVVAAPTMSLYQATITENVDEVRANIAHGADLNEFTADGPRGGFTALHAASRANYVEIARLLIEAGADINIPADAPHRATPLHWAARSGNLDVVKLLVEAGADLTVRAGITEPQTPMGLAMTRHFYDVVEYLAENGGQM